MTLKAGLLSNELKDNEGNKPSTCSNVCMVSLVCFLCLMLVFGVLHALYFQCSEQLVLAFNTNNSGSEFPFPKGARAVNVYNKSDTLSGKKCATGMFFDVARSVNVGEESGLVTCSSTFNTNDPFLFTARKEDNSECTLALVPTNDACFLENKDCPDNEAVKFAVREI